MLKILLCVVVWLKVFGFCLFLSGIYLMGLEMKKIWWVDIFKIILLVIVLRFFLIIWLFFGFFMYFSIVRMLSIFWNFFWMKKYSVRKRYLILLFIFDLSWMINWCLWVWSLWLVIWNLRILVFLFYIVLLWWFSYRNWYCMLFSMGLNDIC